MISLTFLRIEGRLVQRMLLEGGMRLEESEGKREWVVRDSDVRELDDYFV